MITEAQIIAFIDREQDSSARAWHDRRARPEWEQVDAGELITNLTLERVRGQELWLRAPTNESKFRRGDTLLLRGASGMAEVKVTYLEDSRQDQRIKCAPDDQENCQDSRGAWRVTCWISPIG